MVVKFYSIGICRAVGDRIQGGWAGVHSSCREHRVNSAKNIGGCD